MPSQTDQTYQTDFKLMYQALFIGLSQVNGDVTQRGLFNQMLATYIFLFIFSQVVEQILPMFVSQRTLYEARERPAKAYSWVVFLAANIIVELAWNSVRPQPFPFIVSIEANHSSSWPFFRSYSGTFPWVSTGTQSGQTPSIRAASQSVYTCGPSSLSLAHSPTC